MGEAVEMLLVAAAVAHVSRDLGKAEQGAIAIADGINHGVGPEAAAVLAEAPVLDLATPFGERPLQRALRQSGDAVFLR